MSDNNTLFHGLRIVTVLDYFAHTGQYLVAGTSQPPTPAVAVSDFACVPLGVRSLGGYPPKTTVLALFTEELHFAVILGAVPANSADPSRLLPDSLTLCGRAGFFQEEAHHQLYANAQSMLGDFSAGRAADTMAGDWGAISELGLAIFLGKLMAGFKASDAAKVEAFFGDDLLRLTGYNLETLTAATEHQHFDDEGEIHDVWMGTPFAWEGLGAPRPEFGALKDTDGILKPNREEARLEPQEKSQVLLPRHILMRGYLGDTQKEWIVNPRADQMTKVNTPDSVPPLGLLEVTKHIDGSFALRSAKEVAIEKYILIPAPQRKIYPEDPTGDTSENYTPAGQLGDDKYDMSEYDWKEDGTPNIRAAKLLDQRAFRQNRQMVEGLSRHKKDWKLPEESEIPLEGIQKGIYDKNLRIKHKFTADLPNKVRLPVDGRAGHTAEYYASKSGVYWLDDGSMILEDGYGSQAIFSGGNIFFKCVGDIWMQPGRNFICWAPHDAVLRAGNSIDLTAAQRDIRFKAERNLHMLAGNSGQIGGVLIESRSQGFDGPTGYSKVGESVISHGIVFKSVGSRISAIGKDIYIGRGQEVLGDGNVTLDSGIRGDVYLRGRQLLGKATTLIDLSVLPSAGQVGEAQSIALNPTGALISASMYLGGSLITAPRGGKSADIICGGNFIAYGVAFVESGVQTNGAFASFAAAMVGPINDRIVLPTTAEDYANTMDLQVAQMESTLETKDMAVVEAADAPGNDDMQKTIGFSCRDTDTDIKLDATFKIPEARWQQILRSVGDVQKWNEPVVLAPNGERTLPHPGRKGWEELFAHAQFEGTNFPMATGKSVAREQLSPEGVPVAAETLKDGYLVNTQD